MLTRAPYAAGYSKDEILAELYRLHVVLCNFTTHLPKPSLLQVLVDEIRFYNFINFLLFLEPSTHHNAMRVDIYI